MTEVWEKGRLVYAVGAAIPGATVIVDLGDGWRRAQEDGLGYWEALREVGKGEEVGEPLWRYTWPASG